MVSTKQTTSQLMRLSKAVPIGKFVLR